jgi:hypothetical protein
VLIAGEDGFETKDHRTISRERSLLKQRCSVALGGGQGMIVTHQNHVGGPQGIVKLFAIQKRIVVAEGLGELAKIFAAAVRILGADFALYSRQRMTFRCAAPRS